MRKVLIPRCEPKKPLAAFDWDIRILIFEIRILDFAIEREIRKRISLSRNPSSVWISIKKLKSDFMDFHLYRSIGKSEKGFAKLFFWTVVFFVLILLARARSLFLRTVFQILFRITQKKRERKEIQEQISQRWNPFSDFAFDCKSEMQILKSNSRFSDRTHPCFEFFPFL